uniref:sodium-dependent neutral amino acid transporter B(0)AT2-like n=1 Tax=Pristiophorus japonicus TaxID=55135 RepID=UPI00398EA6C7
MLGFVIGMLFTQRSGNYFVMMFDDYSATLPLIIVVLLEVIAVAWIYGADRFMDDIQAMIGRRPVVLYKYMWKFVCPIMMVALLLASLIRMCIHHPTYRSWNQQTAEEVQLEYPDWALTMMVILIIVASMPIPLMYVQHVIQSRRDKQTAYSECVYIRADGGDEASLPVNESEEQAPGHNGYLKVETDEEGLERELLAEEEGDAFEMGDMSPDKEDELRARV